MERRIQSCQFEGEGQMRPWLKWTTSTLVLLSYSVLVGTWTSGNLCSLKAAPDFDLDDQALMSALNLSNSPSTVSTTCENFLLSGVRKNPGVTVPEKVPIPGWSDGKWHQSTAPSDSFQQRRSTRGGVGDSGASFSVNPATHGWPEWSSCTETMPVHAVEGVLELKNFWSWNSRMEAVMFADASGVEVDLNRMLTMQNLKIYMKGAFIDTNAGRRICMTGCAYRTDHYYKIDCGFHLQMTYPSRQPTSSPRLIEAELSRSTTRADDPLRFPTVRIEKDTFTPEYSSKVFYLRSAVDLPHANHNTRLRRPSSLDPAELVLPDLNFYRHPRRPNTLVNATELAADLAKFREDYYDDTYSGYH